VAVLKNCHAVISLRDTGMERKQSRMQLV